VAGVALAMACATLACSGGGGSPDSGRAPAQDSGEAPDGSPAPDGASDSATPPSMDARTTAPDAVGPVVSPPTCGDDGGSAFPAEIGTTCPTGSNEPVCASSSMDCPVTGLCVWDQNDAAGVKAYCTIACDPTAADACPPDFTCGPQDCTTLGPSNVCLRTSTGCGTSPSPSIATDNACGGPVALASDGANIWVACQGGKGTVAKLAGTSGALLGTYTAGTTPEGIVFDGAHIWVANYGSNNVSELDTGTGAVVGTYPTGMGPTGIAFDGTNLWVANQEDGTVTKLAASTGALVGTYHAGDPLQSLFSPTPIAVDTVHGTVWVANTMSGSVTKLVAATGAVAGTYPCGNYPTAAVFDGTSIWVGGSDSVTKLDPSAGAILGTYAIVGDHTGMAFDGTDIWVANFNNSNPDGTVTQVAASDGTAVGTYTVGTLPIGVLFDTVHHTVWVANSDNSTVTSLSD